LASYGDLLTRDLSDVSSRDLLCEFSLEELDDNFARANDEPELLRATQATARNLQSCQNDWEEYVRGRDLGAGVSDELQDQTARDLEEQLEPMQEQFQALNASIDRLQVAAQTIEGLILIHIDFCRPQGSGNSQ
jgi:hypothetical protein